MEIVRRFFCGLLGHSYRGNGVKVDLRKWHPDLLFGISNSWRFRFCTRCHITIVEDF